MSFLHRSIEPMGRLTVQVVVRSWGLVGLPSTLTVNVDDDVSEEGFQVRGCFLARVLCGDQWVDVLCPVQHGNCIWTGSGDRRSCLFQASRVCFWGGERE